MSAVSGSPVTPTKRGRATSPRDTSDSPRIFVGRARHPPFVFDSSEVSGCNRAWLKGEGIDEDTYTQEKRPKRGVVDLTGDLPGDEELERSKRGKTQNAKSCNVCPTCCRPL